MNFYLTGIAKDQGLEIDAKALGIFMFQGK